MGHAPYICKVGKLYINLKSYYNRKDKKKINYELRITNYEILKKNTLSSFLNLRCFYIYDKNYFFMKNEKKAKLRITNYKLRIF